LYLDFEPAARYSARRAPPDPLEVFSALEKPDLHGGGLPRGDRAAAAPGRSYASFAPGLEALREKTGRPHWLVVDDAQELRAPRRSEDRPHARENTIYVTADPDAVSRSSSTGVELIGRPAAGTRPWVTFRRSNP
jgi:hypothetical protein